MQFKIVSVWRREGSATLFSFLFQLFLYNVRVYNMASYKGTFLDILDFLTCPHCKDIFTRPVTLDCGHSVCSDCAEKIVSKNKAGKRCYCPKCGVESVTEYICSRVNWTLWKAAAVVHVVAACFGKECSNPEVSSAGDSESGCSGGSSCSIRSMKPPPFMASTRELFIRMFLPKDGLENEGEHSQRRSGSSDCSEREQRSEDGTSTRGSLSGSGGLCEPELPQHTALASIRAQILDLLTHMLSDGTGGSVYKTRYEEVFLHILKPLTCTYCKMVLRVPVTLDCGHNVCLSCAEKIGSKNEEGQQCCCCPKCGVESVMEDIRSRVNWTLTDSVDTVRKHAVCLWIEMRTHEARSAGDSGVRNIKSECSLGSFPPPYMLPKTELFDRMFF